MKILTIAIPTFNRYNFLKFNLSRLINEIKKNKLKEKINIIVGNNGSTDKTSKLIAQLKERYSFFSFYNNKKNLGYPANVFKIIEKSPKSKYLWLLSDDDFLKNGRLKKIINYLEKYNPDVLYLNYRTVNIYLKNKIEFKNINSIISPGFNLKKDFIMNKRYKFFNFIKNLGSVSYTHLTLPTIYSV